MNITYQLAWVLSRALGDALWQLCLVGLVIAPSLWLLRRHGAAARHALGMVGLLTMALLPIGSALRQWPAALARTGVVSLQATEPSAPLAFASHALDAGWSDGGFVWVTQLWLIGVLAMLVLRFGGGWHLLRRIERSHYSELPPAWSEAAERLKSALGIARQVSVRLAERVGTPFTARLWRPVIWLPAGLLDRLPTAQIRALLAHELAHIRRLDWLWNGVQCVVESLLFFHPVVWWLSGRVRREREMACDELAVGACGDPLALAEALQGLARQGLTTPPMVLSARGGSLTRRIARMLEPTSSSRPAWRIPAALVLLLSAGALCGMQVNAPVQMLGTSQTRIASTEPSRADRFRDPDVAVADAPSTSASRAFQQATPASTRDDSAALPAIETPPTPPAPPPPPTPPSVYDSVQFKALLASLRADPVVASTVGADAGVDPGSFDGDIRIWNGRELGMAARRRRDGGKAEFTLTLRGHSKRIRVAAVETMRDDAWTIAHLDLTPLGSVQAAASR